MNVIVLPTAEALARYAAGYVAEEIRKYESGRVNLGLAGGSTPILTGIGSISGWRTNGGLLGTTKNRTLSWQERISTFLPHSTFRVSTPQPLLANPPPTIPTNSGK